jgi:hypothetical protein
LHNKQYRDFGFAQRQLKPYYNHGLSGGVMVAQGPLEAFDMVRVHAGQPFLLEEIPHL